MSEPVRRARAVHRGYHSARTTRLHIIRDKPVRVAAVASHRPPREPRPETWCGQSAATHTNSPPVVLDPMPAAPPEGLTWCPQCIGHLAEWYGLLGKVAGILAEHDPEATP